MNDYRTQVAILLGVILTAGSTALAQTTPPPAAPTPAAAPAASTERKEAEKAESPSYMSELEPAIFTFGVRAWEKGNAEGIGDLLLPVYATRSGLFYLNPRSSFRGEESEMNLGAGFRQMLGDRKMIVGANAYYDRRETEANNRFHQAGFGLEFLSEWVDARVNYYLPEDDIKTVSDTLQAGNSEYVVVKTTDWDDPYGQGHAAYQQGTRTESTTLAQSYTRVVQEEQAMEGFDCEVGVRLPIPVVQDWSDVKLFAGYYHYDSDISSVVEGWKGRLEVRALPALLLDAEVYEDDDLNGSSYYVGSRLQVPFDLGAWAAGKNPFAGTLAGFKPTRRNPERPFDSRLTEMVMRDPRVQTQITEAREITTYTVSELLSQTQKKISDVLSESLIYVDKDNTSGIEDGTFEHPYNTIGEGLAAAGGDLMEVYVFDSQDPYKEKIRVDKDGLSLIGSGSGLAGNGGKAFATGIYPILKGNKWTPAAPPDVPNVKPPVTPKGLGTMTILADDVLISGFEFRGQLTESIQSMINNVPNLDAIKGLLAGAGKDTPVNIPDILSLLQGGLELSGIVALDANNLTVYDNRFKNQAIGVLSVNGPINSLLPTSAKNEPVDPHTQHTLLVGNNLFEGNGVGLLSVGVGSKDLFKTPVVWPPVPSTVTVAGNAFHDNLIGLGVVQLGGGLDVTVADNQFANGDMPAGVAALIGNVGGDMKALISGNTVQGNHTLGMALIQESGALDAAILDNRFEDCQLTALAVEANVLWGSDMFDNKNDSEEPGNVNLLLSGNLISGTGRSIEVPEWIRDLVNDPKGDDSGIPASIPMPDVPAVLLALVGNEVDLEVSGCEFNDNAGGALLGLAYAERRTDITVSGVSGKNNGTLFGDSDWISDIDPDWDMDDEFPTLGSPFDYSFVMGGDPNKGGAGAATVTGSSFENSGKIGAFLGDLDPLIDDIVDAL